MATGYKRLSFSNEEEFKLIEFVKKHPALWDATHGEYGNSELRKLYWISLAKELKKSVFECRRKWRFVRDYYIHKRRRQPESTPQRDGKYYSLQFLNKVKVSSKKFSRNSDEAMGHQQNSKHRKNVTTNTLEKIGVDYVDSDEEIDYDFLDDPALQITVERIGNDDQKYLTTTANNDTGDNCLNQYQDVNTDVNTDNKSEDFLFKEDYIDEESSEFAKQQNIEEEEIDGVEEDEQEQEEHLMVDTSNDHNFTFAQGTTQTDSHSTSTSTVLQEKAIDLFFQSMAAAVKTFPPQYIAEAKCKVFMAFNEIEAKVYKNANKN